MFGAAITAWVVTALVGLLLAAGYARRGATGDGIDHVRDTATGRLPGGGVDRDGPAIGGGIIGAHALLALVGLALLIWWATNDGDHEADYAGWGVVIFVLVSSGIGAVLFGSWQRPEHKESKTVRSMPAPVVYLHGIAALATIALVLAAAFSA